MVDFGEIYHYLMEISPFVFHYHRDVPRVKIISFFEKIVIHHRIIWGAMIAIVINRSKEMANLVGYNPLFKKIINVYSD